jgi:hypothetical protein
MLQPMSTYDDTLFDLRVPDLVRQDAGHAIIAHALVDQMLGTLILAYLPSKLSDSGAAKLFSRRGPFSSLLAKIAFARAEMEAVRDLRNHAVDLAIAAAQKLITAKLTPDRANKVVSESIKALKKLK